MRGTYTIVVQCDCDCRARFRSLGVAKLESGQYLYTGSAVGAGSTSLEGRIGRHQRRSKKVRWHIDYLTSNSRCTVTGAAYLLSSMRLECKINQRLSDVLNLRPILPGIGASDCRCNGHLLGPSKLTNKILLRKLAEYYRAESARGSQPSRTIRLCKPQQQEVEDAMWA